MDILISSFNVVVPFVVLLLLGLIAKKKNIITPESISGMSSLIYNILLPAMLISNILDGDSEVEGFAALVVYMAVWLVAIAVAGILIVPKFVKKQQSSAFAAGILRGNFAIYGLPLAQGLLDEKLLPDLVTLLIPGILISNILALVVCELMGEKDEGEKFSLLLFLKKVFAAPIVSAVIVGMAVKYSGIVLPEAFETSLSLIGGATTPIAFLCIGATFKFDSIKNNIKLISVATALKLVVIPTLVLIPSILYFNFDSIQTVVLLCIFATPTAATASAMVKELRGDSKLIGEITMFGTIFSVLSLFVIVTILRFIGVLSY